ncbi:Protein STB5 [Pseudocercospora fuligena]|uniref:Protein STB5 n=1 Tax=Pseudocercospora fuligena TaxID=685502 RepID=A0A8H6VLI3_9PEZI|nr:Protein STB5 [Pseudocercospora fuligena]
MAERGQLQACKRCRTRKRTCDKALPRCTICSKAKKPYIFVDTSTGDEYTREQIAELEEREASLRSRQLRETQSDAPGDEHPAGAYNPQAETFVGDASGSNILESVLGNPQFGPHLLKRLLVRPRIEQPEVLPNPLPTRETAEYLCSTYIRESHTQKPFLSIEEVHAALQGAYAEDPVDQDRFTLLMVCAIAGVALRRRGLISQHPYGFFLTARTLLNSINLRSGLPALKNLLLLARFAVYFHIGLSSWEIGRICILLCVQMDLHRSPNKRLSAAEEQQRRILFWESYILDRHCSTILGRPFAIADEEIDVALPINASPITLQGLGDGNLEQHAGSTDSSAPEPVAVFIAFIKLRQLSSRIHTAFFTPKMKSCGSQTPSHKRMLLLGEQYSTYSQLSHELNLWRSSAPIFARTETFYQSQEWYDFLLQKERLLLVRGIMAALKSASPPEDLRQACCECAAEVVRLFGSMYWTQRINCTRHYFQILLIAGLLLAYHSPSTVNGDDEERLNAPQTARTLAACSNLLESLGAQMLDALPYSTVFNVICDSTFPDWSDYRQESQQVCNSAPEENHGTFQNQINQEISDLFNLQPSSNQPQSQLPALNTFPNTAGGNLNDWMYSPGHLFADMESFVNQFATGDYTDDPMFGLLSWNVPFENANTIS